MQENIRLIILTLLSLVAIWFVTLTVNRNIFIHTDRQMAGSVPYIRTDIGAKCGTVISATEIVEYKLNAKGQIVYLCPQSYWPIQKQVVAVYLSPELKQLMGNNASLQLLYPDSAQPTASPATNPQPVAAAPFSNINNRTTTIETPTDNSQAPGAPQFARPGMNGPVTPAAPQTSQTPATSAPASNPFIGAPAAAH